MGYLLEVTASLAESMHADLYIKVITAISVLPVELTPIQTIPYIKTAFDLYFKQLQHSFEEAREKEIKNPGVA